METITLNNTQANNLLRLCKYYKIYKSNELINILVYKELRSLSTIKYKENTKRENKYKITNKQINKHIENI